jgi:23S rRNA-/tRNA-specific pseudouridylate synthase
VLSRAGADGDAVADGRVFIGRRRALSPEEPVAVGDEVHIAPKSQSVSGATLLLDEDGLVAADKPAAVTTIPGHGDGAESLLSMVARTLGVHPRTLHPTSRLDRGVSGVVVFARTTAAADRLAAARARGSYSRRYLAIAASAPSPTSGEWTAAIGAGRDPRHRGVGGRDPAAARSRYGTVARAGEWALLGLEPVTGRTHQLRVHASHAGAPLLGDRSYGGPTRASLASGRVLAFERIALHAARVRVPRSDGSVVEVSSPVPDALRDWWQLAGGADVAWALGLTDLTALRG